MIKAVGGEEFDTGKPSNLWAVWDNEFSDITVGIQTVERRLPVIECRSSDVTAHELVKDTKIRRLADDAEYFVRRIEPDGTGMSRIRLRS